jgi:hypothetical protein
MKLEARVAAAAAAGILTVTLGLSGCSPGRWFEHPQAVAAAAPPANAAGDLKLATVTYIREVCELPKEQRDPVLRALNEFLVPNHAVIYCGRGGTP